MRVVFMGSPEFASVSLSALIDTFEVVGVVTQPDRPAGRGRQIRAPAVKQLALEQGIPVVQPPSLKAPAVLQQFEAWQPEVVVVAAFGRWIPESILNLSPAGCVNVHPSLLPRWRGASPIQTAILHGDAETGVTLIRLDAGLDTGPIIAQERVTLEPEVTAGDLSRRLAQVGAALLVATLPDYVAGKIDPTPQDDSRATYAPAVPKSAGQLDFNRPAVELARQVRAYEPRPGSFLTWRQRRLIVRRARARPSEDGSPGEVIVADGDPAVITVEGLLVLEVVQPEGKASMEGSAFIRGAPTFAGSTLSVPHPA